MEILIAGLLLVALMVYASTRIKRTAAEAFEQETVETDDFSLIKPEGFLYVINGDPAFAFQAYSREFGIDDASNQRKATSEIVMIYDRPFSAVCEAARKSGKLIAEKKFQFDEMHVVSMTVGQEKEGQDLVVHHWIADGPKGVFEMKTSVLKAHDEEYLSKINQMEESISIKK
ncbi:MAG: hypothetical protein ACREGC_03470 [Minisyncoccia bacterium]